MIQKQKKEAHPVTPSLQEALYENKILFKELHHRTKNNLQLIISLIRMQADKAQNTLEAEHFIDLENRIHAIAQTHEIVNHADGLEPVDMRHYIQALLESRSEDVLLKVQNNIILNIEATVQLKDAIYVGIMLNEMLSNSIKYAFSDEDKKHFIQIDLQEREGVCLLTYKDSGPGFDEADIKEDALGLALIKTLVINQLEGSVILNNNTSTEYIVQFRL